MFRFECSARAAWCNPPILINVAFRALWWRRKRIFDFPEGLPATGSAVRADTLGRRLSRSARVGRGPRMDWRNTGLRIRRRRQVRSRPTGPRRRRLVFFGNFGRRRFHRRSRWGSLRRRTQFCTGAARLTRRPRRLPCCRRAGLVAQRRIRHCGWKSAARRIRRRCRSRYAAGRRRRYTRTLGAAAIATARGIGRRIHCPSSPGRTIMPCPVKSGTRRPWRTSLRPGLRTIKIPHHECHPRISLNATMAKAGLSPPPDPNDT